MVAALILGIISLQRLAVELFPELHYPSLIIQTRYSDATPEEIVEFVTRPIEEAVSAVSGIKHIKSRSRTGISIVSLEFYWGTDMDYASLKVREKLDEIRVLLPATTERSQLLRLDPSAQPIMQLAVSGAELSQLTDICRQVVRRRLEQSRGIAFVEVVGGFESQIEVQIDPEKLHTYDVTADDIAQALRANNITFTGGTIKGGRYRVTLRVEGELQSLDDIRQVAIMRGTGQSTLLVGDIANVFKVPKDRRSLTRLNGTESVGLMLTKEADANTISACKAVRSILNELEKEYPDLEFFVVSQQADFIEKSLSNVMTAILWGGLLAFLSLIFFLRTITYPLTISVSMPVSIIATFIFMYFADINLNMMSLGGLALGVGILVDNSIIVLENVFRLRETGHGLVQASIDGAHEVAMPVLASTLTTVAVFIPVSYIRGIAGQLFRDLSMTVSFSLICSLLISLSLLPVLLSRFRGYRFLQFPASPGGRDSWNHVQTNKYQRGYASGSKVQKMLAVFIWIKDEVRVGCETLLKPASAYIEKGMRSTIAVYHRFLRYCLDRKGKVLISILIIFSVSLLAAYRLDRRLFPPLQTDDVKYLIELSPDATLHQTAEVVGVIENRLLRDASVDYVFSRIGSLESILLSGDESYHRAELTIRMKEEKKISHDEFINRLSIEMPRQYQYQGHFESGERIYRQILGLFKTDLQIDVRGASWEKLVQVAREIEDELQKVEGVQSTNLSYRGGATQIRISVDREAAISYGIDTKQIADVIRQNVKGTVATQIKEFDRFIDVVVRPDIVWRDSWEGISSRMLSINGTTVTIEELIHQSRETAPDELLRDEQENVVYLNASLSGISMKNAIRQAENLISRIDAPENVHVEIGGQHIEYQQAISSIRYALILSLVLVYIILAAQFESLLYPLIILLPVPLGMVGGIWLLALTGNSLNVISGIGFIVLAGIVVNDAIIKIDFINRARSRGKSVREAIYEAGEKRFRPIVITTITTVFGLLPMALAGGAGSELRQPLALVLIGGLSIATVFTLIVIPIVYESMSKRQTS